MHAKVECSPLQRLMQAGLVLHTLLFCLSSCRYHFKRSTEIGAVTECQCARCCWPSVGSVPRYLSAVLVRVRFAECFTLLSTSDLESCPALKNKSKMTISPHDFPIHTQLYFPDLADVSFAVKEYTDCKKVMHTLS